MKSFLIIISLFIVFSVSAQKSKDSVRLAKFMTGNFSNDAQIKQDSTFLHIQLAIVPIWKDRKDAHWFYVEQAMVNHLGAPYRQRVYRLTTLPNGEFESAVYTLKGDLGNYVGHPDMVEKLTPDSLYSKAGCSVFLKKESKNKFVGSTRDKDCFSELRGASYASSEATITPEGIISWDRGFNKEGMQVWGSDRGGYDFKRMKK